MGLTRLTQEGGAVPFVFSRAPYGRGSGSPSLICQIVFVFIYGLWQSYLLPYLNVMLSFTVCGKAIFYRT